MITRRLARPLACALILATVPVAATASDGDRVGVVSSAAARPAVARGLIVKTTDGLAPHRLRVAADRVAGPSIEVTSATPILGDIAKVSFDQPIDYAQAAEIAADVERRADVVWAIPDGRVRASAESPVTPNDPNFAEQSGVWDATIDAPVGGFSVKAPALWKKTRGSSSVVVAVIDTGITDHPDLNNQLVAGYDFIGADTDENNSPLPAPYTYYSANDGDGRDSDPSDPGDWVEANDEFCYGEGADNAFESSSWHGTHVAGIIAAQADNGEGISGIAPRVTIQPVRALGTCGGYDSDILDAMVWASGGKVVGVPANTTPADVINLSLGAEYPEENAADRDAACQVYGEVASAVRKRGTTVVAAAGNESGNADLSVPASCPGFLSVGATSQSGHQAFYSNEGASVDLSAPGGDFVVTDRQGQAGSGILSTLNSGERGPDAPTYGEYMGTSMAAPAVSAGAALIYSLGVTDPASVESTLEHSVSPFARHDTFYDDVVVTDPDGSNPQTFNLNCDPSICGAGILDLARVPRLSVAGWPSSARYGVGAKFTASVADGSGPLSGVVRVLRGSTVVASAATDHGLARLTIPGTSWVAGKNAFRIEYVAAGRVARVAKSITPRRALPTSVKVSVPATVSHTKRAKLTARITVKGVKNPRGTYVVYDGSKRIAKGALASSGQGVKTITLPRLARGKHRITVRFAGTSLIAPKSSAVKVVRSK